MAILESWSTKDGAGNRWSLIRQTDATPATMPPTRHATYYVKGPSGLYGPYREPDGEQRARARIAEEVGVPVAIGHRHDDPPVEPIGPYAPGNDA